MPVLSTLGAAIANVYGFTSGLIKDQYFNLVSLLLPGNGTDGKQNRTFLDSSGQNGGAGWTITPNGNATQGTFSPFSQTGWGAYFDGSNDNVSFASGSQVIPATGDFTIEAWIYPTSVAAGVYNVIYAQTNGGASAGRTSFQTDGSNIAFQCAGTYLTSSSGTLTANRWNYVAATRTGSSVSLYVNGSATTGLTASGSIDSGTSLTAIGANWSPQYMAGYISNFRVSTTIRSNLTTVPTSPFTNDANTRVLTLQNNRFIDNSSSPFTLTANNGVAITPFSPFAPTQSYSAAAVGGSGYFDGTGDYLTANSAGLELGSNLFTIDGWFYCTGYNGGGAIYSSVNTYPSSTGLLFYVNSTGGYVIDVNGTNIISTGTAPLNTWTHFAIVRSSTGSNGVTLYINGSALTPGTSATNFSSTYAVIGRTGFGAASNYWLGYLSGIRVVVGSANVPSSVPTAPPTAITNTQLLLNFTNAGVVDATAKNVLETVGNAQISTTQSKWGGGSMYFDGTGDYLKVADNPIFSYGTGDFTVEFWMYPTTTGATKRLYFHQTTSTTQFSITQLTANTINVFANNSSTTIIDITGSTAVSANTWTHVAVVRSGSTFTLYQNGTSVASGTSSASMPDPTGSLYIGALDTGSDPYTGYIDDYRITRGYARYTSNFTAPTAPFPVQ